MTHTEFIASKNGLRLFWLLFAMTLLVVIAMQITGQPLKTTVAPGGIVSFELIGSLEGSRSIIDSWQGGAMSWAGINLGMDFLFLTFYGITIALGCLITRDRIRNEFQLIKQVGMWMAVGVLVAAGLDVIENVSLIALLVGSENELLPVVARYCAIPKFFLVAISLLYTMAGLFPVLRKTNHTRPKRVKIY